MKRIYHIFTANRVHLSPQIIKGFQVKLINYEHVFLLWRCNEQNKVIYNSLRNELQLEYMYYMEELADVKRIIPVKDAVILLHSFMPRLSLYLYCLNYKKVNAVCWGSGVKLDCIKNYIYYPIKFILYHYYDSIVALMKPDQEALRKIYKLENIHLIPYIGDRELLLDTKDFNIPHEQNIVYVGNNSSCIDSYIKIAKDILWRFGANVNVQFMLHYGLIDDAPYRELAEYCKKNPSWQINTEFYDIDGYLHYMSLCSVYVCGEERQTGLGAIYTCLRLGKKIFLKGNNYDWIISLGCKIYHVNEIIDMSYENFISPLNEADINKNQMIIKDLESTEKKVSMWDYYLTSL